MTPEDEEFNRIEMESRIKQEYVRDMQSKITVDGETLKRMIAEAVAKEREACAKLGEDEISRIKPIYSVTAENIVKAIRARGKQ